MWSKHLTLLGLLLIIADTLRVLRASHEDWLNLLMLPIAVGAALGLTVLLRMRCSSVGFVLLRITITTIASVQCIIQATFMAVELVAWQGAFFRHLGGVGLTYCAARSAINADHTASYHRVAVACVLEAAVLLWFTLQSTRYTVQPVTPYPFGVIAGLLMTLGGTLCDWHTHRRTGQGAALPPASIAQGTSVTARDKL